jgi:hypothetical protein
MTLTPLVVGYAMNLPSNLQAAAVVCETVWGRISCVPLQPWVQNYLKSDFRGFDIDFELGLSSKGDNYSGSYLSMRS